MIHLRMSQESTGKRSASSGGTETAVWNICLYQVPEMVGTNDSTKKSTSFTTQWCRLFKDEEETAPQKLEPCVTIFLMGATAKKQV